MAKHSQQLSHRPSQHPSQPLAAVVRQLSERLDAHAKAEGLDNTAVAESAVLRAARTYNRSDADDLDEARENLLFALRALERADRTRGRAP